MTPAFVLLGRASGEKIAELESSVENLTQILGFLVVAVVAVLMIHLLVTRRLPSSKEPRATTRPMEASTGPQEAPPAPRPAPEDVVDGDRP